MLVDSPDSSETGLLLQQQRQQQQLPRPHTTTAAAAAATTGAGATPGGAAVEAGDRSTSPASVAAARGDGGHGLGHGQQRSRPPSSMGGAADAGAAEAGAAAGAEGGGGEGPSLALRVKTLDSKEHRVAVPATATVAEVRVWAFGGGVESCVYGLVYLFLLVCASAHAHACITTPTTAQGPHRPGRSWGGRQIPPAHHAGEAPQPRRGDARHLQGGGRGGGPLRHVGPPPRRAGAGGAAYRWVGCGCILCLRVCV